jgi:hypothetical protein
MQGTSVRVWTVKWLSEEGQFVAQGWNIKVAGDKSLRKEVQRKDNKKHGTIAKSCAIGWVNDVAHWSEASRIVIKPIRRLWGLQEAFRVKIYNKKRQDKEGQISVEWVLVAFGEQAADNGTNEPAKRAETTRVDVAERGEWDAVL